MKRTPAIVLTMAIPHTKTGLNRSFVVHGYGPATTVRHQIFHECHTKFSWLCISSSSTFQPIQHPRQDDKLFLSRMTNDNNDDDCDFDHHHYRHHPLTNIGAILQNRLDDHVGKAFIQSGSAWLAKDWDGVTVALEEASLAISHYLRESCASADAIQLWTLIAQELKDISTIEGCSSVGPPASIPNWVSIQAMLRRLAASDFSKSQDGWLEKAATEIDRLIDSI
jgi:hypothetical protein